MKKELQIINVENQHFSFQGIPLEGSLNKFVKKLQKKGYILEFEGECNARLTGKFANSDVMLLVASTPISDEVYQVMVFFVENIWSNAKNRYLKFKDMLSKKYGDFSDIAEVFFDPYYEGDGYEFTAIRMGEGAYYSRIDLPLGSVSVQIVSSDEDDGVVLAYNDFENYQMYESENDDIAFNDI